jgi:hypothetical protein
MSSPIVSFDGISYEITLFRTDASGVTKAVKEFFCDHRLTIYCAPEDALAPFERSQIKGPVSNDGNLYYLCGRSNDISVSSFTWLQNKEEADALGKAIRKAEGIDDDDDDDTYYHDREDYKCTFCGAMASECGEDHGDEMRDIMREYRNRHD